MMNILLSSSLNSSGSLNSAGLRLYLGSPWLNDIGKSCRGGNVQLFVAYLYCKYFSGPPSVILDACQGSISPRWQGSQRFPRSRAAMGPRRP